MSETNSPTDLRYSTDHEWVRIEEGADGPVLRIGITDYAQDALGDVVFVELPAVGSTITSGDSVGEVESTKSVSDIYAPVTGRVVEVNEALADEPSAINSDPYGGGWLCVVADFDPTAVEALMDAAAYTSLIAE